MSAIAFKIGEKYENRKGPFEVVTVKGNEMRIRWENGEEVETTRTLQTQIIRHMELECELELAKKSKKKPKRKTKK